MDKKGVKIYVRIPDAKNTSRGEPRINSAENKEEMHRRGEK